MQKIWNWIKDHTVAIGVALIGVITIGRYAKGRRDDRLTVSRNSDAREREVDLIASRSERTVDLGEEFLGDCEGRLEEAEQHLGVAEDTVEELQRGSGLAEQACDEIRRRLAESKESQ